MPTAYLATMFGFRSTRVDRVALRLESLGEHEQHRARPAVSVFRRDPAAAPRASRQVAAVFVLATAA